MNKSIQLYAFFSLSAIGMVAYPMETSKNAPATCSEEGQAAFRRDIDWWSIEKQQLVCFLDAALFNRRIIRKESECHAWKILKQSVEQGRREGRRTNLLLEAIMHRFNDQLRQMLQFACEESSTREELRRMLDNDSAIIFSGMTPSCDEEGSDFGREGTTGITGITGSTDVDVKGTLVEIARRWGNEEAAQMLEAAARELQPEQVTPLHNPLVLPGLVQTVEAGEQRVPILGQIPIIRIGLGYLGDSAGLQ